MGRTDDFAGEAHEALSNLGYSHAEIAATNGALPESMGTEERLRHSLRALQDVHTETVQRKVAERISTPFNPKQFPEAAPKPDADAAYWQGRKDAAFARKSNGNQTPKAPRATRPPPDKTMARVRKLQKLARLAGGKKR